MEPFYWGGRATRERIMSRPAAIFVVQPPDRSGVEDFGGTRRRTETVARRTGCLDHLFGSGGSEDCGVKKKTLEAAGKRF